LTMRSVSARLAHNVFMPNGTPEPAPPRIRRGR
jgi:hypothetical protein